MVQSHVDSFAEELAAARQRSSDRASVPGTTVIAAHSGEPDYRGILEKILSDADRKNALRAMAPEQVSDLTDALATISRAKRAAYDRALHNERQSSFGWVEKNPAVADALRKLNAAFVEINAIPMAPCSPPEDI